MASADTGAVRNESVAVGTTAVRVAPPRSRRLLYIYNTSTGGQKITIQFGDEKAVVAGQGFVLVADNYLADGSNAIYKAWQGSVWAISSAAGGTISVVEI